MTVCLAMGRSGWLVSGRVKGAEGSRMGGEGGGGEGGGGVKL